MAIKIDKTDLKILKTLQVDGRMTNLQLSNEVGLSPAPTLERVRKLEKHGIIDSYHAQVNADRMGMGITAIVQVSLTRQIDNALQNFKRQIMEIDEVVECLQVTGTFDYQLRVIVKDIPAFDRLISDQLSKVEEIGQMQTYVVLSTVKKSNILPLNY
ncbi:Lrp/AsnC family transcriptional regulator [Flavobacteriales bacterium]|nr:Lrp/AsnC family transcriptional regulator [Flavobacteriales bacterium]